MVKEFPVYPVAGRGLAANSIQAEVDFLNSIRPIDAAKIYRGTFNVYSKLPVSLDATDCLNRTHISAGLMPRFIWSAKLDGRDCYVMRWKNCPFHIFEILADYKISEAVGSSCCFRLTINSNNRAMSLYEIYYWNLVWYNRYDWWYQKKLYWRLFRLIRLKGISGQY